MQLTMEQLCLNNAINRADFDTLVGVKVTFTLNAFFGVDLENHVTFKDGFNGANGFASGARNAIIQYFHCHGKILLCFMYQFSLISWARLPFGDGHVNGTMSHFLADS